MGAYHHGWFRGHAQGLALSAGVYLCTLEDSVAVWIGGGLVFLMLVAWIRRVVGVLHD